MRGDLSDFFPGRPPVSHHTYKLELLCYWHHCVTLWHSLIIVGDTTLQSLSFLLSNSGIIPHRLHTAHLREPFSNRACKREQITSLIVLVQKLKSKCECQFSFILNFLYWLFLYHLFLLRPILVALLVKAPCLLQEVCTIWLIIYTNWLLEIFLLFPRIYICLRRLLL